MNPLLMNGKLEEIIRNLRRKRKKFLSAELAAVEGGEIDRGTYKKKAG
jgi:hypothetical protein